MCKVIFAVLFLLSTLSSALPRLWSSTKHVTSFRPNITSMSTSIPTDIDELLLPESEGKDTDKSKRGIHWTPPFGVTVMQSFTLGQVWQKNIDIHNYAYFHRMAHQCSNMDEFSFLTKNFTDVFGPLELIDGRWVYYVTNIKKGVWYEDFLSVLNWGKLLRR